MRNSRGRLSLVGADAVKRIIDRDMDKCLEIIRSAYLLHDAKETVNPQSVFLRFPSRPGARIIALPAHIGGDYQVSGVKWISSFPKNVEYGRPRASAVLILNDCDVGQPYACLEGSIVSASRTAASAALAAERMVVGGKSVRTLGLIGAGVIARRVIDFLRGTGWEIERIRVYDTNPDAQENFVRWVASEDREQDVALAESADAILATSDLSVIATVATVPHISGAASLRRGRSAILHLSLRDLDATFIHDAQNVVDDLHHVNAAGTSIEHAIREYGERGIGVCTLADLLVDRIKLDFDAPIVFSPFGLGVLDVMLGRWVLEQALASGAVLNVEGFFHT